MALYGFVCTFPDKRSSDIYFRKYKILRSGMQDTGDLKIRITDTRVLQSSSGENQWVLSNRGRARIIKISYNPYMVRAGVFQRRVSPE